MGKAMQPASDNITKNISQAVQNKQTFNPPEDDLINTANAVTKTIGDTYNKKNLIDATNAIGQGDTDGKEADYNTPARKEDVIQTIHDGDTFGMGETMSNPDPKAGRGAERTLRQARQSVQEIRLMFSKLTGSQNSEAIRQGIDREQAWLDANKVPELIDFTQLDWKNNPDKALEYCGEYFRESVLGTHLFGFALDAMQGKVGPVANQVIGAITGIAHIYNATDDIMAAIPRGTAASSADSWDFVVGQLTKRLPLLSRQSLQFMNHVLSKQMKAKLFEGMMGEYRAGRTFERKPSGAARPSNTQKGQP